MNPEKEDAVLNSFIVIKVFFFFQNPREASSRSRIFLFSLVNVSVSGFVQDLLAKRKTLQT